MAGFCVFSRLQIASLRVSVKLYAGTVKKYILRMRGQYNSVKLALLADIQNRINFFFVIAEYLLV